MYSRIPQRSGIRRVRRCGIRPRAGYAVIRCELTAKSTETSEQQEGRAPCDVCICFPFQVMLLHPTQRGPFLYAVLRNVVYRSSYDCIASESVCAARLPIVNIPTRLACRVGHRLSVDDLLEAYKRLGPSMIQQLRTAYFRRCSVSRSMTLPRAQSYMTTLLVYRKAKVNASVGEGPLPSWPRRNKCSVRTLCSGHVPRRMGMHQLTWAIERSLRFLGA
jgi:hypothetical protein